LDEHISWTQHALLQTVKFSAEKLSFLDMRSDKAQSTSAANILNEACYLSITKSQPDLEETERWLQNLSKLPQIYRYWQPEPNQPTIVAELFEIYQEVMAKREPLRGLAECYEVDVAEVSRDLFAEVMAKREWLRGLAETYEVDFAEVSRDLLAEVMAKREWLRGLAELYEVDFAEVSRDLSLRLASTSSPSPSAPERLKFNV